MATERQEMSLDSLNLWADEEGRIQSCLIAALNELIAQAIVGVEDKEDPISGKLRPLIIKHGKRLRLISTLHHEASVFESETSAEPSGHPDFQFSFRDKDSEQWDYDVECKLVRVRRTGKAWDYCEHYVADGMKRFASGRYCAGGISGVMIGYVQEGEFVGLLLEINRRSKIENISVIRRPTTWQVKGVTRLKHSLSRKAPKDFALTHLWADLR
jgi:hypothetical protein